MRWLALTLVGLMVFLSSSSADDKRSKIPALTFVRNYEGEVVYVDSNSDVLKLRIKEVVPKWVAGNQGGQQSPPGALRNFQGRFNQGGGGSYVPSEQVKEMDINLSPDVKVRLMYGSPAASRDPKSKPDEDKEAAETKEGKDKEKDKAGTADDEKEMKKPGKDKVSATKKPRPPTAKELAERDPDYKLGGNPGKKSQISKGQMVRVAMGRNNDRVNPQIYAMVVYVVKEGK